MTFRTVSAAASAAVLALGLLALPALADDCKSDISKIDAALKSQELDPDVRAQAEDMRNQAVQLCGAGNTEEGTAVTAEAKALLNVD